MAGDVQAIRAGLAAVGEGRRDVRLALDGDDEMARLARQVEAMVEQLARAESARNDLVAAVSHDLRTPITSLRLLVEALDDDILDDGDRKTYLARLRTHVGALGALIDDLFELSRLQAGELRWSLEQVRLASSCTRRSRRCARTTVRGSWSTCRATSRRRARRRSRSSACCST